MFQAGKRLTSRQETAPRFAMCGSNAGDLGIGCRQEQDIARRLAKIERLVAVGNRAFLGKKKMHQLRSRLFFSVSQFGSSAIYAMTPSDAPPLCALTPAP
jgi:hypothetical protein